MSKGPPHRVETLYQNPIFGWFTLAVLFEAHFGPGLVQGLIYGDKVTSSYSLTLSIIENFPDFSSSSKPVMGPPVFSGLSIIHAEVA